MIVISFLTAFYFYPQMPFKMASHWGINGEANGYMTKFWGLFFMPILSVIMFLLFLLIPKIDPMKENIQKFKKQFDIFILIIISFIFYIYLLTIFWNLGARFNMVQFMAPFMGVLFFYSGILIENSKRNWFVGIRTPWTLSSENVWNKTHKLGGKLFKISGALVFLGFIFPQYAFFLILLPVIASSLYSVIYSYAEFKKEKNNLV